MAAEAGLLDHPWVKRHKLDVVQYHRMEEAGVFEGNERVELIEGEIVEMSDRLRSCRDNERPRALAVRRSGRPCRGGRRQLSASTATTSPSPTSRCSARVRTAIGMHPTAADTLLLIARRRSLRYDRKVKLPLYARHGVPELWIVDLEGGTVEVCREPRGDGHAATLHAPGDVLEPALLPGVRIAVTDIIR